MLRDFVAAVQDILGRKCIWMLMSCCLCSLFLFSVFCQTSLVLKGNEKWTYWPCLFVIMSGCMHHYVYSMFYAQQLPAFCPAKHRSALKRHEIHQEPRQGGAELEWSSKLESSVMIKDQTNGAFTGLPTNHWALAILFYVVFCSMFYFAYILHLHPVTLCEDDNCRCFVSGPPCLHLSQLTEVTWITADWCDLLNLWFTN